MHEFLPFGLAMVTGVYCLERESEEKERERARVEKGKEIFYQIKRNSND